MIIKATLSKILLGEELVWHVKYLSKITGNNTIIPLYPKDIPYLEIDNLKEHSSVKISIRYYSEKTGFLFPSDMLIPDKFITSGQFYQVAKISFIKQTVKFKDITLDSVMNTEINREEIAWNDFYESLDKNFKIDSTIFTDAIKKQLSYTHYPPMIKK